MDTGVREEKQVKFTRGRRSLMKEARGAAEVVKWAGVSWWRLSWRKKIPGWPRLTDRQVLMAAQTLLCTAPGQTDSGHVSVRPSTRATATDMMVEVLLVVVIMRSLDTPVGEHSRLQAMQPIHALPE
ncbi:hypothetical protein EX30DRAFT_247142 [Ascodesmis nigricans]|uniref:Uncharacterized protein n=1 Tax=Ascodesmis nigricans TaxID=341454 RepID=A0A4S2MPP3_9PEZI|nr:hypothetical protein EX30DRAFT_247142 [Ascodesmis nigricans]